MLIARTLDNKRLTCDGRIYIEIPKQMAPDDAVVVHKKRLPQLRGVVDVRTQQLKRDFQGVVEDLGYAMQVFEGIRGESQHCDECHAFERAQDAIFHLYPRIPQNMDAPAPNCAGFESWALREGLDLTMTTNGLGLDRYQCDNTEAAHAAWLAARDEGGAA